MKMIAAALGLVGVALLGACAGTPGPAPLPYAFTLGQFSDARPDDDDKLMSPYGFDIAQFMTAWTSGPQPSVFAQQNAKLNVKLVNYASSSFNGRFAVSMMVELSATDEYGRLMGRSKGMCSTVESRGADIGEIVTESRKQGYLTATSGTPRDNLTWRRVFTHCTEDLKQNFTQTLMSHTIVPETK